MTNSNIPAVPEPSRSIATPLQATAVTPDYFVTHYREFIPRYIAKGTPTEDTMLCYTSRIDAFIRWCLDNGIHPLAVQDYQMRIYREYLNQKQYKNDTKHIMIMAVKAFFNTACKMGLVNANPCDDISTPPSYVDDANLRYYTLDQMRTVCEVIAEEKNPFLRYRNLLIVYLMGVEGMRNVELHRACLEDINWDLRAMMVRGKGTKERLEAIYPCAETFSVLEQYLAAIPKDIAIKREGMLTPLLLSNSHNHQLGRMSRGGIRYVMNETLKKAGLKYDGLSCHIFRHSCGTNLYQATKDLRVVQETLRQKDPKVTARYAHVHERLSNRITSAISLGAPRPAVSGSANDASNDDRQE